jgi:lipoprotein-releasing system permease protein
VKGFSWYIARRYLATRKKGRFLSFITWIALGGITVGVTALIVVIGVMNGMQEELQGKILGATPHIYVLEYGESLRMSRWQEVADSVMTIPEVTAVTPWALSSVIVSYGDYNQPAELYGIRLEGDPADAATEMEAEILAGVHSLSPTDSGRPPIILGSILAERMGVYVGDNIRLYALEGIDAIDPMGNPSPSVREFEVTGTFTTGMYEYDIKNMYAPLEWVQSILRIRADDRVSGLGVRIRDHWAATEVADRINEKLGLNYKTESWITMNRSLFAALKLEKLVMGLILLLIVLVASFNIVSTLVMVVVDRTSEIGILKSMGMTDAQVLRIFILQGFAIGFLGTALGTGLGLLASWILHRYQIIEIPAEVYFVDRLPVSIHIGDLLLIVGASLLISLVATIYPALQASRLEPVEAIKDE